MGTGEGEGLRGGKVGAGGSGDRGRARWGGDLGAGEVVFLDRDAGGGCGDERF